MSMRSLQDDGAAVNMQLVTDAGWFRVERAFQRRWLPLVGVTAWGVYSALLCRANRAGQCWPSIPTIAAETGLGQTTVRRALRVLVEHQLIRIEPRRDEHGDATSHCYTLIGGGSAMEPGGSAEGAGGSSDAVGRVVPIRQRKKNHPKNNQGRRWYICDFDDPEVRAKYLPGGKYGP